jgi:hypothetical protein
MVELVDVPFAATDLQIAAASYERQVNELLENDDEAAAYARAIEEALESEGDAEVDPRGGARLIEELENFLRDQPGG